MTLYFCERHHRTTLGIPIIEFEKNIAHKNLLEKPALVN